jgi:hypothetical protein
MQHGVWIRSVFVYSCMQHGVWIRSVFVYSLYATWCASSKCIRVQFVCNMVCEIEVCSCTVCMQHGVWIRSVFVYSWYATWCVNSKCVRVQFVCNMVCEFEVCSCTVGHHEIYIHEIIARTVLEDQAYLAQRPCWIPAVSVSHSRKLLSGTPPETSPPNQCDHCLT